uniref:Uncharacterized protein n=1 Tax=Helianthus annuus TaxID=4232 RepID=A0A251US26_HELAN
MINFMSFYVFKCLELNNYEKLMFCRLNTKIGRVSRKISGVELKILGYGMIKG